MRLIKKDKLHNDDGKSNNIEDLSDQKTMLFHFNDRSLTMYEISKFILKLPFMNE